MLARTFETTSKHLQRATDYTFKFFLCDYSVLITIRLGVGCETMTKSKFDKYLALLLANVYYIRKNVYVQSFSPKKLCIAASAV